ncbi:histidinol dehydrogenase [Candidatus Aquiluna sp. IMCC13023]|uniref:histidinol dehydrogenase n=1 Tax=Candidatus Aquiluna sp. IMCC13023 TaxID=1081644 RepID=UPI00025B156A|nr:histidinol dehydrogenase [Candidatus Aquiluna sp. IMCC13023]EIC91245.1 histidinol dehydrogenase [Candidatus Aquiluna sp. IMCC13023]
MRKIEISGQVTPALVAELLPRASVSIDSVSETVSQIIAEVKQNSLVALDAHAERFDGLKNVSFRVPKEVLVEALNQLDKPLREAIETAITRVRAVSMATMPASVRVELDEGAIVEQLFIPVDSVGLYVPGGKAVYPSSVVMNVVPAQVARVPRIAVSSPAQENGLPSPSVMATCALLGIDEVYGIGGASAVAAFAYGVTEINLEPVAMVTGPGNIFVAAAKRQLRGVIGIDSEAGPTEILIVADESANPRFIAADLISQAEHDQNAAAVLVTDSASLIEQVEAELLVQVGLAKNRDRIEASLGGIQSALVLVTDMSAAMAVANEYATEHLEIQTANSEELANQVRHAGAVFVGAHSPVSLGDYLAGSNHVLPTGQQAKFSSGLSVFTFLRTQQHVTYSADALASVTDRLRVFSEAEKLSAHGRAGSIRLEE